MAFSVSVIIPAYNVDRFIEQAIASVAQQPEVAEIVVVDDGSTDASLEILKKLQTKEARIKIYQHDRGENRGRSASRNLGINKATAPYVAFLDADDYYLEGRFIKDGVVLKDTSLDGAYNAVGFHFYRETTTEEQAHFKMSTLSKGVVPEDLFDGIVMSALGYLHLNGITVKRALFETIGLMNESLVVAEDSDIIFKMALKGRLAASAIEEPQAKRGVHDANVFTEETLYEEYNIKLYESLIVWSLRNDISKKHIDALLNALWVLQFKRQKGLVTYMSYWGLFLFKNPKLIISILSVKYFPVVRLRQKLFPALFK